MNSKRLIYNETKIIRKPPVNLSPSDEYLFANETEKVLGSVYLWSFSKLMVDSSGGIYMGWNLRPILKKGIVRIKAWLRILTKQKSPLKVFNGLVLTDENSGNYFHWLLDVMPKIQVLRELNLLQGCTLLVPFFGNQPYVYSLCDCYPELKVQIMQQGQYAMVHDCMFMSELAQTGNYRPAVLSGLKHNLLRTVLKNKPTRESKIWISRKNATKRKIENEAELMVIAQKYGWKTINMEDLTIAEQIGVISTAKAVGGMSGAGLSNILFLDPGKPVLEIRYPKDSHTNCFYSLADANENPYFYLEAESIEPKLNSHEGNVKVDCQKFENILMQMENYLQ